MTPHSPPLPWQPWQIFLTFLRLGLTSFGGPVAHLGYFRTEFVTRQRWLSDASYADLVALCQFLPGPASSQVGIALGLLRGGYRGAMAAWLGFTLPSALLMISFALSLMAWQQHLPAGLLQGLKVAAVAVVAQAVWGMAKQLCQGKQQILLMTAAAVLVLLWPLAWIQVFIILLAGVIGAQLFKPLLPNQPEEVLVPIRRSTAVGWLILFIIFLAALPLINTLLHSDTLTIFNIFYRAGSLVFGGGHVVLPLLQTELVPTGWIANDQFLAGYGAAQAVPGPLFTFAAFLGASLHAPPTGWSGGILALLAIFLPSFFLVFAALPFWANLRRSPSMQAALTGINAAVVGLLLAALYNPVWVSGIHSATHMALALVAFVALQVGKLPAWAVVLACGFIGAFGF